MPAVIHRWIIKGCPKCHGDLHQDLGDMVCLQCGWRGGQLQRPIIRNKVDYRTREIREMMRSLKENEIRSK